MRTRTQSYCTIFFMLTLFSVNTYARNRVLKLDTLSTQQQRQLKGQYPQLFDGTFSLSDIDNLIRSLMTSQQYDSVQITRDKATNEDVFRITTTNVKRFGKVSFSGNQNVATSEIERLFNFQYAARFERNKVLDAANNLKELYNKNGFLNAKIEIGFGNDANYVTTQVTIDEGVRTLIREITLESKNNSLNEFITPAFRPNLKSTLNDDSIQKIIESTKVWLAENRYLNSIPSTPVIEYFNDSKDARIKIPIESPFKYNIFFENNSNVSSNEIYKELKLSDPTRLGANTPADIEERIRNIYKSKGYVHVEVSYKELLMPENFLKQVTYTIAEGKRVKIDKWAFEGVTNHSTKYYKEYIESHSTDLIDSGYYNQDDVDLGLKNLTAHLLNEGYLRAKIISTRTEFNKTKDRATVYINIDEGPLTILEKVEFKGAKHFNKATLLKQIQIEEKSALKLNLLEESLNKIKDLYLNDGYLDVKILNEKSDLILYNEDNTKATVTFNIYEGPQIVVSNIAVSGNSFTKDYVIIQELDFKNGDILTIEKIKESEARLQKLSVFGSVEITTLESGSPFAERTVIVRVSERDPGLFNIGGGVNNDNGLTLRAYTGLAYRNLFGTARAIQGRLEISNIPQFNYTQNDVTAGYLEPFVFSSRTKGRVNYNHSRKIFDIVSNQNQVIGIDTDQIDFLLETDITRYFKLTWKFWGLSGTKKYEAYNANPDVIPRYQQQILQFGTMGPTFEYDKRDNPFVTTKGHYSRLSIEYARPEFGSNDTIHYLHTTAQINTYHQLFGSNRLIFANSARGGYLVNLSQIQDSGVPEEKAFFLGGRSSLRGFDQLAVPDRNEWLEPGRTSGIIRQDSHFYLVKSEIRFPIYGEFGGVVFYDGGAVLVSGKKFSDEYRDAAGAGLRYNTPVGPVSFEYGVKLDRKQNESEGRIHFSMGTF